MPARKSGFNLHKLFTQARIFAVELACLVVFLVWLYRSVAHELSMH